MKRKISVIGLGYVGLPVAVAFGKKGKVIGFDINEHRISELREGRDSTREVEPEELKNADIYYTSNPGDLSLSNFHIVAVPTPINDDRHPNLTPLLSASTTIGRILKPGDIIVYESTVYPGCTEEDCIPLLERESGLKCNIDFGVGYSPERINPGDKQHSFTTIKKIVSGSRSETTNAVSEVYSSVVKAGIHQTSSIKVAEAAKVIENAQRDLNIAFVNELAMIFNRLGIDTHEVLEASRTKWNFLPFYPGLVGGHCIGVDPYYLTHMAERAGYHTQVILAGRRINDSMGVFVAKQIVQTLATAKIGAVGAGVIVLGVTFKENCPDMRNSLVPNILAELKRYGCKLQVHDPVCDPKEAENNGIHLCEKSVLIPAHAVLIAVAHKSFKDRPIEYWRSLLLPGGIIADVKGVTPKNDLQSAGYQVWRL